MVQNNQNWDYTRCLFCWSFLSFVFNFVSTMVAVKKRLGAEVPSKWHQQIDPLLVTQSSFLQGGNVEEEGHSGGMQNTMCLWIIEHRTVNMCWMSWVITRFMKTLKMSLYKANLEAEDWIVSVPWKTLDLPKQSAAVKNLEWWQDHEKQNCDWSSAI